MQDRNNFELRQVIGAKDAKFLYELLGERDIAQTGISHEAMPSYAEHCAFIQSRPYRKWCIIRHRPTSSSVGMVYLTHDNEIGVQVARSWQCLGIAEMAVQTLMSVYPSIDKFLAHINPLNSESIRLFHRLGFFDCQITLQWRRYEHGSVVQGSKTRLYETLGVVPGKAPPGPDQPADGSGEAPGEQESIPCGQWHDGSAGPLDNGSIL